MTAPVDHPLVGLVLWLELPAVLGRKPAPDTYRVVSVHSHPPVLVPGDSLPRQFVSVLCLDALHRLVVLLCPVGPDGELQGPKGEQVSLHPRCLAPLQRRLAQTWDQPPAPAPPPPASETPA